jgi:alpha-ketoglutarate-dependent taurine dioxygenase
MAVVRTEHGEGPVLLRAAGRTGREISAAVDWISDVLPEIQSSLTTRGAVLLRGLPVASVADLVPIREALLPLPPDEDGEAFAPRRALGDGLVSAIRWPPERMLCPHHEQCYSVRVPRLLMIACLRPAATGGETLLSDARQVLERLPAALVEPFRTHGWQLRRTFRERIGTSWREAFAVADVAALEDRLRRDAIGYEWLPDGALRTTRVRPAVPRHPVTGEPCWFNHAGFLSEWSLDPAEREVLLAAFGRDGLPTDTAVGDGTPLSPDDVRVIERTYEDSAVPVSWRGGDLLLLDNILTAHGRRSYTGDRQMALAFAEPVRLPPEARPPAQR